MAVRKIAKSKHKNQKRSSFGKPTLAAKTKQIPHTKNKKVLRKPKIVNQQVEKPKEENDEDMDDLLDMVDNDDVEFLKSAVSNKSYKFLDNLDQSEYNNKAKRRKLSDKDDDKLELEYEGQIEDNVTLKPLLPIKTKEGIIRRNMVEEQTTEDDESMAQPDEETDADEKEEPKFDDSRPISTAQLLATRSQILQEKKIEIGSLSAAVLETPEEKVCNLKLLLNMMDQYIPEVYFSIRKLAAISLLEVFKDLLPGYQIKTNTVAEGVKLKKDTQRLHKYEELLLLYYKKFLQKLERLTKILIKKQGDNRVRCKEELKLGELGLNCLCDLLVTHPYFNYAENVAQVVAPFLNHRSPNIRQMVKETCKMVFKEDKKHEISLKVLRVINQLLKKQSHNVHIEVLETLLVLKIKDVNLDREKEQELKEKKLQSHKQNVLQLSKKERKRKKRLQELEKELLETKAEENKQAKQHNLTEITKVVFGIYFRVLKSSTNPKILGVCLEGLAKFAHCINLEFYIDLVNVLDNLLKEDWMTYREKLHCIQTVFIILIGQGEALNVEPSRFYTALYKDLLGIDASTTHDNFPILLRTLDYALLRRRKKLTNKRIIGFIKRLSTLSLQLLHGSSLGSLGVIKQILQTNKATDILLDVDTSVGDGKFQPEIDDPEYANASTTAVYETTLLERHYHPIVRQYVKHIARGVPGTGEGSLPPELSKCLPDQLFKDYDMSEMAFKPAVPVPRIVQLKSVHQGHHFSDGSFENFCRSILKNSKHVPFYIEEAKIKL